MTLLVTVLLLGAGVLVVSLAYLGWRDRHRQFSAEDGSDSRARTLDAERHVAEGHSRNPDRAAGSF